MELLIENFEPNLIPNNGKDGKFGDSERANVIAKNGGITKYKIGRKKDGIRLHAGLSTESVLSRALKIPKSIRVINRFDKFNKMCVRLKIQVDGELYEHGLKFNQIQRFYSNTDVESEKNLKSLTKEKAKDSAKFFEKYEGDTIEFLTKFRDELKFWLFDGIVLDRPDLIGYEDRMSEIMSRILKHGTREELEYFVAPEYFFIESIDDLNPLFELALELGWEGLVLTHFLHEYKYGRNSLKQGTLLKMKNDALEYDGVIVDIVEGDRIKEGVERVIGKFNKGTATSRKKGDREPNGKAKGILIEFEGKGLFTVGLKGFNDDDKKELLDNKDKYIGRHFKYKAMTPVKDFPRHAYFDCFRDEK